VTVVTDWHELAIAFNAWKNQQSLFTNPSQQMPQPRVIFFTQPG
jgi:hypothetical protein